MARTCDRSPATADAAGAGAPEGTGRGADPHPSRRAEDPLVLFLCGDVMLGRGLDQAFARSADPGLHESFVRDARRYLELAERAHGPIPAPLDPAYPWGDALAELERAGPHARIANLETAVTARGAPWPGKGIHYRTHPANVACLEAAGIDACSLANNHVLDWGWDGLADTLATLRGAGIRTVGAGEDLEAARRPAVVRTDAAAVRVFGLGAMSSGIPRAWGAAADRAGVWLLPDLSARTARDVAGRITAARERDDIAVVSIHWGSNWGYEIPPSRRAFAHRLIDAGAADVVHGHSSHHPKGIEIHRGRPILYGCGDFLDDYEGIEGHEEYRPDLAPMYFVTLDRADGRLAGLELVPLRIRRFRLERAPADDARWLRDVLDRESRELGARVVPATDDRLSVEAAPPPGSA